MAGQSQAAKKLKKLRERAGLSVRQAAQAADVKTSTYSYYEDGFKKEHLPLELVRKLARAFEEHGVPGNDVLALAGIFDNSVASSSSKEENSDRPAEVLPYPLAGARDLPVLGAAKGGRRGMFMSNGEIFDHVARPGNLVGVTNAYAVYMVGDSMEPRYYSGWLLGVHPSKPFRRGHNVVVQLQGDEHGDMEYLVKEFVKLNDRQLVLRQLNPEKELSFPASSVRAIHRITGSMEDD